MAKVKSVVNSTIRKPTFDEIKSWFNENMHPSKINLDEQEVYKYVYHDGRFAGIFQCIEESSFVTLSDRTKLIKDVVVGDDVVTFDEKNDEFITSKVLNIFDQGTKECIELTFDNGKTLVCTADHRILTVAGWKFACDLCDDDLIVSFNAPHT